MGLQIWLPFTDNTNNQGLAGNLSPSAFSLQSQNNGKIGKCYYGNAIYHLDEEILGNQWTIALWIKATNFGSYNNIMLTKNNKESTDAQFYFSIIGNTVLNLGINGSAETYTYPYTFNTNTWYHVAATYDGIVSYLYLNGTQVASKTTSIAQLTGKMNLGIGCRSTNVGGTQATGSFSSYFNDIRIYDTVLSPEQIKDISRGLILHYPLSGPIEHQVFGDAIEDKETYLIRRTPGYNLINNLYAAGRTTINGSTITLLLSQNADTYFNVSCSEPLIAGQQYTLSLKCSGFPTSENYLVFGIISQNSGKNITMKNGYCKATFSPTTTIAANTKIILDDLTRTYCGFQDVTVTDIKLEKGEVETPWIEKNSEFDQIVGGSICWNQWGRFTSTWIPSNNNGITYAYTDGTSVKINGTATAVESRSGWFGVAEGGATKNAPGHVFLLSTKLISGTITSGSLKFSLFNSAQKDVGSSIINRLSTATPTANASFRIIHNITNGTVLTNAIVTLNCFDLTLMFGPTIADYILSLENTTAGKGVAWFRNYFPKDYYPYCAPTMKSVTGLISHNTTGFNYWTNEKYQFTPNKGISINEDGSIRVAQAAYQELYNSYPIPVSLQSERWHIQFDYKCVSTTSSSAGFYIRFSYTDGTYSQERIGMGTANQTGSITLNSTSGKSVNSVCFGGWSYSGVANISNICLNIYDAYKNGTYEPYVGRSYALDSNVVLRGFWKLDTNDNNKLYCDGDIYSGDGSIVRNYKQVVLDGTTNKFNGVFGATNNGYCAYVSTGLLETRKANVICDRFVYSTSSYSEIPLYGFCSSSGANATWSFILPSTVTSLAEANTWLTNNPTTIVVKLDTPTTETATPFSNPQVCSIEGTEEYVMAEQDGVVIPAGHQTKYLHDVLEGRYHTYEEAVSGMGINDNIEYDVSGFGNNGTINGSLTVSSDTPKYNISTYVNSSSSINHSRCLSNDNQEWTCCAWVKLDGSTSYQQLNNFNNGNMVVYATTPILYLNGGSDDYYMYGSQVIPVDEWTHIAFVFKNSTGLRNIYINGILKNNSGPNKTSTPSGIPDVVKLFGQNFSGYVSDYREYATALSASDVAELYNAGVVTT